MTLAPRSGFSTTTTAGNNVPNEIPNTQLDIIPNMPYVSDPALNKYAINAEQYPRTLALLAGYMRGTRIKVTYFRQCQQGSTNVRTNLSDYNTERNALTSEFERIFNFEITIPEAFKFTFDTTNSSGDVNGQALFYAGLEPTNGDMFLYSTGNGKYGIYRITNVNPMNWTNDRVYMVDFVLQSFPDSSDMDGILGPVVRDLVWTKSVSYGQAYSVISSQAYLLLEKIKVFRSELSKFYHRMFFDKSLGSYVRPDQIYDPCAVRFAQNKIVLDDVTYRAKQLFPLQDDLYESSLWGRLEDRYVTSLNGINPGFRYITMGGDSLATYLNELFGYTVLLPDKYVGPSTGDTGGSIAAINPPLCPGGGYEADGSSADTTDTYLFSKAFWSGDSANMSTLESVIYQFITTRAPSGPAEQIADIMQNVYTLDTATQYYVILIYLHMIDMLVQYVPQDLDSPIRW